MTTILINDDLKLVKEGNKYIIQFERMTEANVSLIKSLTKTRIIQGATVTRDYLTCKFQAQTVTTLETFFKNKKATIFEAANILKTLATQLNYLNHTEHKTILGYEPSQIILINDKTPAYLGIQLIADMDVKSNLATICCLFNKNDFFAAPELLKITRLPSQVHYKVSYFSLAYLIIYLLVGETEDNDPIKHLDTHHVKDTKLYWLLSRCLELDPNKRSIIFI